MSDKCKKLAGSRLSLCDQAHAIAGHGLVTLQTVRDHESGKTRQQLAIVHGKKFASLQFCPWCRGAIDTRPVPPSGGDGR
jgi:hypothetical protein